MSNLKFFFIFPIKPDRSTVHICSLKKGSVALLFILVSSLTTFFILDLKYSNDSSLMYILAKHFIYSFLNFVSFVYIIKSTGEMSYREAYFGNLAINWSFIIHLGILAINLIFSANFTAVSLHYIEWKELHWIYGILVPQIVFLVVELFTAWICYSYTKNVGMGNDALADGQNFDRYVENLASSENSKGSSRRNSERSMPLDYNIRGKNVNNIQLNTIK
jgi:cytochrome c oxidase subunit IV